jgi:hypothetical protein
VPGTKVPTTRVPTTQVPTTEVPTTQVPSTQVPSIQVPTTQLAQVPTTQVPSTRSMPSMPSIPTVPRIQVPSSAKEPTTRVSGDPKVRNKPAKPNVPKTKRQSGTGARDCDPKAGGSGKGEKENPGSRVPAEVRTTSWGILEFGVHSQHATYKVVFPQPKSASTIVVSQLVRCGGPRSAKMHRVGSKCVDKDESSEVDKAEYMEWVAAFGKGEAKECGALACRPSPADAKWQQRGKAPTVLRGGRRPESSQQSIADSSLRQVLEVEEQKANAAAALVQIASSGIPAALAEDGAGGQMFEEMADPGIGAQLVQGGAEHKGADHQGADHRGADHQGADHQGADHRGADHQGADHP